MFSSSFHCPSFSTYLILHTQQQPCVSGRMRSDVEKRVKRKPWKSGSAGAESILVSHPTFRSGRAECVTEAEQPPLCRWSHTFMFLLLLHISSPPANICTLRLLVFFKCIKQLDTHKSFSSDCNLEENKKEKQNPDKRGGTKF